eukprot:TRINITY_DN4720_c1_g1_i1.p4 TRINITY_DN4720_c1_g1~~TRINITY_DN4720_c1_g1_i1.p4  ORF type:complete len:103 (+),score=26.23 TRINITY_DN4720_c1_g1_i1:60-368(+)
MSRLALLVLVLLGAALLAAGTGTQETLDTQQDTPMENGTVPPDEEDDSGMSFGAKFIIFLLTYLLTVFGCIFGIKMAREHGYCKPQTTTGKLQERFLGGGGK